MNTKHVSIEPKIRHKMSIEQKYAEPVFIFLAVYIFNFILFRTGEMLFVYARGYLEEMMPHFVKAVSPMQSPTEYDKYLKAKVTIGALIGLCLINYLALRLDNKKFELIITRTDGQYRMREGVKLYCREFLLSDVIASTLPIIPFIVTAELVPEKLMDRGLIYVFKLGVSLGEFYGTVGAVIVGVIFSFSARVVCIPFVLRTWRALWLSGSV